ncbi:cytochrome P450 family protein [Rhizoctonia solani]|uniref:Cytochrome P450 family protein n=1 Tax=Rhizoctonia solani TaxID=456999 RepID=A0A8H8SYA6_9AGAM|nr:cytochrome P450 family protein [Rhizoctonia solani]QRW21148.1 cytochrome P450 family protein [Rhizoctonia solani]
MSSGDSPWGSEWILLVGIVILAVYWLRGPKVISKLPVATGGHWLVGHLKNLMGVDGLEYQGRIFSKYGPTVMLKGLMGSPVIFSIDPAVIHSVQSKEKDKFHRPNGPTIMIRAVFGGGLFALSGNEHRIQRKA